MIDYRHLRAGNYILVEAAPDLPRPHKVMAKDIYDIATGKVTLAAILPIPLGPEMLERCGFQFAHYAPYWEHKVDGISDNVLEVHKDGSYLYTGGSGSRHGIPLRYLHQLQNFHFALTGTELTVNL